MSEKNRYRTTLVKEALRLGVTVLVIELLAYLRQKRHERAHLKADLIAQLASRDKEVALAAAESLRQRGWLEDGSLRAAKLIRAHLSGVVFDSADLRGADLTEAHLRGAVLAWANLYKTRFVEADLAQASLIAANLQEANLTRVRLPGAFLLGACLQGALLNFANLHGAHLGNTDLRGAQLRAAYLNEAILEEADLRGADLQRADLQAAILRRAKLDGVNLCGAELTGADLTGSTFDEHTTLPDGSPWTPGIDLARFTDPTRADFWRYTVPHGWAGAVFEHQRKELFASYQAAAVGN